MIVLHKEIASKTSKHATAIFYGGFLNLLTKGSAEYIEAQGTLTLLSYRDLCLGVTNQHVLGDYSRPTNDKVFNVAFTKHQPIPGRLLFKSKQGNADFPYDIAVFLLDRATVVNGGKFPLELSESFERLNIGDQALAIGFPGIERHIKNEFQMAHPLYHVVGQCIHASDRTIVLHEKLRPPEERIIRFRGMSGGPIFRLDSPHGYSFSGISFQGRGFDENDDSTRGDDIWVHGFPFGPEEIDHAFDIFRPNLTL